MDNQAYLDTWTAYLKAWSSVSPAKRETLLSGSVSENCVYTDPTSECRGHSELIYRMERSQQRYPGAYFNNEKLICHHAQGLFSWTMCDAAGSVLTPGWSFAHFNAEGRLVQTSGFF
jgi:hypothetical protein